MTIFEVSTADGLIAALEAAQGSDEIRIAPGNYGDVTLSRFTFSSEVTITSADMDNPAVFASMKVVSSSNVVFDGLSFDMVPDEDTVEWDSALKVTDSSSITVRNSVFEGGNSVAGIPVDSDPGSQGAQGILGLPIGRGVTFDRSSDIIFENNEISGFTRGMVLNDVEDAVVAQNEVHHLRMSPFGGAKLNNVTIEDNYFHSSQPWKFGGAGDHGDYIHIWTQPGQDGPSDNIVITNNFFEEGDGTSLLGIYLDDNTNNIGFTNVHIEGNVIYAGHTQAIRLEDVNGGVVINNTLIQSSGGIKDAPGIGLHDGVKNLTVANNIMSTDISGPAAVDAAGQNNTLSNNLTVQYNFPDKGNFFGDLFVNSEIPGATLINIRAIPGSAADGIGSPLTQLDETPTVVTPGFQIRSNGDTDGQSVVLDATPTYGPAGQVLAQDATFTWDFGDGTTGTGRIVEHSYATPGNYDVTLSVVLDGQPATTATTANADVGITGDDIITFNSSDGAFYLQGYGNEVAIDNTDAASVATSQGMALDLGGIGTKVAISREELSRFYSTDAFEMSMTLQADQPGDSWGEVARIHNSIIVSVREDGDLYVRLFPDTGEKIELISSGVSVNDGAAHDISIVFDGASDSLQILIDGQVTASETVTGSMPAMEHWGLIFGVPSWGGPNFDGKLSAFELDAPATDYPVFQGVFEGAPEEPQDPVDETPPEDAPEDPQVPIDETPEDPQGPAKDPGLQSPEGPQGPAKKAPGLQDPDTENGHDGGDTSQPFDDANARTGVDGNAVYSKDHQTIEEQRLAWNNKNVVLSVEGDSLKIVVYEADERFQKAISIDGLGLEDTDLHQVRVTIDAESDHLQVVVDDVLVLGRQQDLDIPFADGNNNTGGVDGGIYDFWTDASADFLQETALVSDDASLMG